MRTFFFILIAFFAADFTLMAVENKIFVNTPEDVVKLLNACPKWTESSVEKDKISKACQTLAGFPNILLRSGIELYISQHQANNSYDVDAMGKLFVLNRYLFLVSSREAQPKYFGGWEGIPKMTDGKVDMLWPWRSTDTNSLVLHGTYSGYSGHPFSALEEFDYFLRKYGRRALHL